MEKKSFYRFESDWFGLVWFTKQIVWRHSLISILEKVTDFGASNLVTFIFFISHFFLFNFISSFAYNFISRKNCSLFSFCVSFFELNRMHALSFTSQPFFFNSVATSKYLHSRHNKNFRFAISTDQYHFFQVQKRANKQKNRCYLICFKINTENCLMIQCPKKEHCLITE